MIVYAAFKVLRSSTKSRALVMRSSLSALSSRKRVAWAYCVAIVARTKRARDELKLRPGKTGVVNPESLSCMSIEMCTVLVSGYSM